LKKIDNNKSYDGGDTDWIKWREYDRWKTVCYFLYLLICYFLLW